MRRRASVAPIVAVSGAVILAACATSSGPRERKDVLISPYHSERECVDVKRGERLDYRFSSDTPLDYEVVSHDGAAEVASIARSNVTADSQIFAPLLPRRYCVTWHAGPAGAIIAYSIAVRPPP